MRTWVKEWVCNWLPRILCVEFVVLYPLGIFYRRAKPGVVVRSNALLRWSQFQRLRYFAYLAKPLKFKKGEHSKLEEFSRHFPQIKEPIR